MGTGISTWTMGDDSNRGTAPAVLPRGVPTDGAAFAKRLHARVGAYEAQEAAARRAPPEVTHRRVGGTTVVSARLWAARTNITPAGPARRVAFEPKGTWA